VRHPQAAVDRVREGHRLEVVAAGLDHQADHLAGGEVQHLLLDQVGIHHRVEERVVDDVVDMRIDVVVHPARRDRADGVVAVAVLAFGAGHGGHQGLLPRLVASRVFRHTECALRLRRHLVPFPPTRLWSGM
jgi:hypothetical protein